MDFDNMHGVSSDNISLDSGFDSVCEPAPKEEDAEVQEHLPKEQPGFQPALSLSVPTAQNGEKSHWKCNGDAATYNGKEDCVTKDSPRTKRSASPYPSAASSTSAAAYSSPGVRNWRSARSSDGGGCSLPLEEFRMAVVQGNIRVVKAILAQGISVDQILRSGWTALMFASSCAKPDIVRLLLTLAADPNLHKEMFTALMAACASSQSNEADVLGCVEALLEFGASASACERHRMTALMFAAKEGKGGVVARLVREDKGLVDRQDNKGWTALCWAATKGHGRVVRTLLEASADPRRTNIHGQKPADVAMAAGHQQLADILERAALKDINTYDTSTDFSSDFPDGVSVPKLTTLETAHVMTHCAEMEMVLSGLQLADLIPLFQANKVTLEIFLRLSDSDLEKMGIKEVGTRMKLCLAIAQIHKQEWKTTSLPHMDALPFITLPDAVAMVANMNRHLRFIHASVGHLRDQIQASPRILQLGQEKHSVATLSNSFSDSLKNLSHLGEEVKFFKAHLDKVCSNAEYASADTILLRGNDGRRWQRSLLTTLLSATCLATALYFCRPKIFASLFSLTPYPQQSVFLDVP